MGGGEQQPRDGRSNGEGDEAHQAAKLECAEQDLLAQWGQDDEGEHDEGGLPPHAGERHLHLFEPLLGVSVQAGARADDESRPHHDGRTDAETNGQRRPHTPVARKHEAPLGGLHGAQHHKAYQQNAGAANRHPYGVTGVMPGARGTDRQHAPDGRGQTHHHGGERNHNAPPGPSCVPAPSGAGHGDGASWPGWGRWRCRTHMAHATDRPGSPPPGPRVYTPAP